MLERLSNYVNKPGIFLEKGLFTQGTLTKAFFPKGREYSDGYFQIEISHTVEGKTESFDVGSVDFRISDAWLQAVGYVSWTWVFGEELRLTIEQKIDAKGIWGNSLECYVIARKMLADSAFS